MTHSLPNHAETKQSSLSAKKTNLWFYPVLSVLIGTLTKMVLTGSRSVCAKAQPYRKSGPPLFQVQTVFSNNRPNPRRCSCADTEAGSCYNWKKKEF